jgi:hypothetical protein
VKYFNRDSQTSSACRRRLAGRTQRIPHRLAPSPNAVTVQGDIYRGAVGTTGSVSSVTAPFQQTSTAATTSSGELHRDGPISPTTARHGAAGLHDVAGRRAGVDVAGTPSTSISSITSRCWTGTTSYGVSRHV